MLLHSFIHSSVPSSYLPVTSIACRVGDEVSAANMEGQTDISHIWDSILENMRQERSCGQNKEYRYCETSGVWGAIDSSECCMFSLSFIYF